MNKWFAMLYAIDTDMIFVYRYGYATDIIWI